MVEKVQSTQNNQETVIQILRKIEDAGRLEAVKKRQDFNFIDVETKLKNCKSWEEEIFTLCIHYTPLFFVVYRELKKSTGWFMEFCRELNVDEEQQLYTLYIFGFWEPWLDQQRAEG